MVASIKILLQYNKINETPINLETYTVKISCFISSLFTTQIEKRLGFSAYIRKKTRIISVIFRKQNVRFVSELSILMRGLQIKLVVEKHSGQGGIQTGKSPIS